MIGDPSNPPTPHTTNNSSSFLFKQHNLTSDHTRLAFSKSQIKLMASKKFNSPWLFYLLLLLVASDFSTRMAIIVTAHSLSSAKSCNGSDITCQVEAQLSDADELPFDLELHRRILTTSLGYQSLRPNVPACNPNCGKPGQSYTGNHCTYKNRCGH